MNEILLEAKGLTKEFTLKNRKKVHAVSDVSLEIFKGETLALVGESGCGKSTLGRALIRLIKATSGEITFGGVDITSLREKDFGPYRRRMQLIFQDPYASLDPRMTVRDIVAEPLKTHKLCRTREEMTECVLSLLRDVGIPEEFLFRYPHQFSGGQRQRIGIARAIALDPVLIVCDEPVSALDVSVQNQILNLLRQFQHERGLSYLFISHDLSVVRFISDRICVMFLGRLCEIGRTAEIYSAPLHPYTRFLINAIPKADPAARFEEKPLLTGELPSPTDPPPGCRFHTRCPYVTERCRREVPQLRPVAGRLVACHRAEELGNAISIVLYPDYHIPFVGPTGQTQLTAGIPQSVGQDIRDRPAHLRVIAFDHDGFFREVRRDGNAAGSGCRLHGAYAVVEQFSNIRFGKGKRLPPHIDF